MLPVSHFFYRQWDKTAILISAAPSNNFSFLVYVISVSEGSCCNGNSSSNTFYTKGSKQSALPQNNSGHCDLAKHLRRLNSSQALIDDHIAPTHWHSVTGIVINESFQSQLKGYKYVDSRMYISRNYNLICGTLNREEKLPEV